MFNGALCTRYTRIKSPNGLSLTIGKSCVTIVLIVAISAVFIFLFAKHVENSNESRYTNSTNHTESEPIGHMLTCNDCCGDNIIDFEHWLSISPPNDEYKLLQSHYITRHGDRTQLFASMCWREPINIWTCGNNTLTTVFLQQSPMYGFILSPIHGTNILAGNCMIGQMTPKGYQQLVDHGNQIRQRYMFDYQLMEKELHDANFESILSQVRLRADNVERVQQSVMAFFLGLYPNYKWLQHQVSIPIYIEDRKFEIITDCSEYVCPPLQDIKAARESSQDWIDFEVAFAWPINDSIGDILRSEDAGYYDAYDCGTAFLCHEFKAPMEFTQELYEDAEWGTLYHYWYQGIFPDYVNATKYHIGAFLKLIYHRFKSMINKHSGDDDGLNMSSLYVYGGHDTGPIVPLLSAFQYNLTSWVPYGATITLELFENKDAEYFVLISYNGNTLEVPRCNNSVDINYNLCEWNTFEEWIKDVTPTIRECPNMKLEEYLTQNV